MATKNNVGGFKQMPKMETTEPTVILKMKKGGHVNTKHLEKGEHGHSPMSSDAKYRESMEGESGSAPKKPSMADRKKAMNPNFKGGGKVPHMGLGGALRRIANKVKPELQKAGKFLGIPNKKIQSVSPFAALTSANPMHKVVSPIGKTFMSAIDNIKKKTAAPMAGLGAAGATPQMMSPGGGGMSYGTPSMPGKSEPSPVMDYPRPGMPGKSEPSPVFDYPDPVMVPYKKGGKADKSQDKAMIKKAFKQHDMQEHKGGKGTSLKLKTGGVTMGNAGGYAAGGTINGNEAQYKNTKMHDGNKHDRAKGTGGVRMGNAGGYAKGGDVSWENRPADTAKPGKVNTTTGEVRNGNAGGYKAGGNASKKAYATGGNVNSQGKAVKMPSKPVSRPVANNLQSGTFAEGGSTNDKYTVKNPKAVSDKASRELEDAMNPLSMVKELYNKGKDYFETPAGSVTKTEKSVTVSPGKKRGGKVC